MAATVNGHIDWEETKLGASRHRCLSKFRVIVSPSSVVAYLELRRRENEFAQSKSKAGTRN